MTAAQTADLRAMQTAVNQLESDIRRLEEAGLDVTELRQRLEKAKTVRQGLLNNFTPGTTARGRGR